jgi:hypothetical protein
MLKALAPTRAATKISANPYLSEAESFLTRAVENLRLKRIFHRLGPVFFHEYASYSWLAPHSYQLSGRYYKLGTTQAIEHLEQNPNASSKLNMIRNVNGNLALHTCSILQGKREPPVRETEAHNEYEERELQRYKLAEEGMADISEEESKEIKEDKRNEERAKNDLLKHMDVFRRKVGTNLEDRYIDPVDGQLELLVVQSTSQIYSQRYKPYGVAPILEMSAPTLSV